jgi:RNA polymerase sigma factor (TIGR02999 family)
MHDASDITLMLSAAREGDQAALDLVFTRVYSEIRRIAHDQLRRVGDNQTLSTTAVVHEAYLKLVRSPAIAWADRGHFYAVAAMAMRQILINHARRHLTQKRGGGRPLPLDEVDAPIDLRAAHLVELNDALQRLAAVDDRLARVVDLRFFAGLSVEETAEVLGVTDRTIKRDWRAARAFLYRELYGSGAA